MPAPLDPVIEQIIPLLPLRDVVVFPHMVIPLFVGREKSVAAVDEALQGNRMLFLATQREVATEEPGAEDIGQGRRRLQRGVIVGMDHIRRLCQAVGTG